MAVGSVEVAQVEVAVKAAEKLMGIKWSVDFMGALIAPEVEVTAAVTMVAVAVIVRLEVQQKVQVPPVAPT